MESLALDDNVLGYLIALARADVRRHQGDIDNFAPRPGQPPEEAAAVLAKFTASQDHRKRALAALKAVQHGGTVVNYVIEASDGPRAWVTMTNAADDEEAARTAYASWRASKTATASRLDYRLVRRTAVVTDEVLETTRDPEHKSNLEGL